MHKDTIKDGSLASNSEQCQSKYQQIEESVNKLLYIHRSCQSGSSQEIKFAPVIFPYDILLRRISNT